MEAQPKQRQETEQSATAQRRLSCDLDLEQLSIVDIDAAMTMSVTDAQFTSVLPYYPVGALIQCSCQVTDERDLATGCWIGLFKVGWASAESDCVCRAECRREGDRTLVAVFTQTQLPRDTHDFYQFCFVAPDGLVKGASSPFLFRGTPSDDFVAVLDEELQGVVVSARTAQLENTMANMRLEHEALRSVAEDEAEQLRGRLSALKEELRESSEQAAAAVEARSRLEARAAEAEEAATRLRAELESRSSDLHRLDTARQTSAARLIDAEEERRRLLKRLEEATREAEAANDQAEAARKTVEMHAEERQRLLAEAGALRAQVDELAERLRRAEVQLADAGVREKRLLELVAEAEAAKEATDADLAAERDSRHQAEATIGQLRSELSVRQHQEAVSGELRAQQARYASLLTAYEGVKHQFHGADERERLIKLKYDEVIACNKQMLLREERLHAKLAELQSRLKEGGCEYKKLMKRYKDLQQQLKLTQQMQQMQVDAAEPDEFHDAQGDVQSLIDYSDDVIHRPPTLDGSAPTADAAEAPRSLPAAVAAAAAAAVTSASSPSQWSCPMCQVAEFPNQRHYEEHVYGHFDSQQ